MSKLNLKKLVLAVPEEDEQIRRWECEGDGVGMKGYEDEYWLPERGNWYARDSGVPLIMQGHVMTG